MIKRTALAVSAALLCGPAIAGMPAAEIAQYDIPFYDHTLPIEARLDDITARLTPAAKGQMISMRSNGVPRLGLKPFEPGVAQHGLSTPRSNSHTVFPTSIAMGATWDRELILRTGDAISDEIRAQYHNGPEFNKFGQRGPCSCTPRRSTWHAIPAGAGLRRPTARILS
ncbi:hypothetical protein [Ferrimonas pelagia]|uniref:Beta-glucosidase n=1 Tax=Ferrimonas pelagia TaxID=1177826 RepID=A0ABP9FJS2_9GAMM